MYTCIHVTILNEKQYVFEGEQGGVWENLKGKMQRVKLYNFIMISNK